MIESDSKTVPVDPNAIEFASVRSGIKRDSDNIGQNFINMSSFNSDVWNEESRIHGPDEMTGHHKTPNVKHADLMKEINKQIKK